MIKTKEMYQKFRIKVELIKVTKTYPNSERKGTGEYQTTVFIH